MEETGPYGCVVTVVPWSQSDLDGLENAPVESLAVGCVFSWRGDTIFEQDMVFSLPVSATARQALAEAVAAQARNMLGATVVPLQAERPDALWFEITDGVRRYTVGLLRHRLGPPVLVFCGDVPPRCTDLWVARLHEDASEITKSDPARASRSGRDGWASA
ncbi:hypothetical protein R5H30_13660 [Sulfitobacter sp. D35]|uniref:hypothetical protein n=1 Tax=Sulfitobacter sp. D35 TaxID=3083252 RepID=UPI00296ED297|nr:hypothetical protein [Sulfitobacter sp. D35]MDW4499037.1 hypothetical protein [Sulfitobacter sp. D35]